jgi:hypothetical protein
MVDLKDNNIPGVQGPGNEMGGKRQSYTNKDALKSNKKFLVAWLKK